MITLYSGTPGSGKSLHVAKDIYMRLKVLKKPVIATFPINTDYLSKNGKLEIGKFYYKDMSEMNTDYLIKYALENHKLGVENQTLVVIDECQIIYNPREFGRSDRLKWIVFFTQHRKLGFNFILISQFDRLIDRQIRCLLEYNVVHRKCNNLGFLWMLPIKFFIAVNMWYGSRDKCGHEFFIYRKKFGKIYDSFMMFDDDFKTYVKENSDKISEFNQKVLGILDKPKVDVIECIHDDGYTDEQILEIEVERYTEMLSDLPKDESSKDVIKNEVENAIKTRENLNILHSTEPPRTGGQGVPSESGSKNLVRRFFSMFKIIPKNDKKTG